MINNLLFIFNNSKSIQNIIDAVIELSKYNKIFYYLNHQMSLDAFSWDKLFINQESDTRIKIIEKLNNNKCVCIGSMDNGSSYQRIFNDTIKYNLVIIDDSNGLEKGNKHGYKLIYNIIKKNNPKLKIIGNIEGNKDFNIKIYNKKNKLINIENTQLESICNSYKICYDHIFCWDKYQYKYLQKYIKDDSKISKIGVPYFDKLKKYKDEKDKKYIILFVSVFSITKKWKPINNNFIEYIINFSKKKNYKLLIKEKPKKYLHYKYLKNENIIVNQCEGDELDIYISKAKYIFSSPSTVCIRGLLLNISTIIIYESYNGQLGFLENYKLIIKKNEPQNIIDSINFLEKNPNYIQDFMKEYYYGYNFNSIDIFVKECNKLINN